MKQVSSISLTELHAMAENNRTRSVDDPDIQAVIKTIIAEVVHG